MSQLLIRPIIGGPYSARDESTVYGYSGMFQGDAHSAPASFTLFDFTVGSHDLAVDLFLIEGKPAAIGAGSANGWSVTLNGTTVMTLQPDDAVVQSAQAGGWPMLWPAGTDVLVLSLACFRARTSPNVLFLEHQLAAGSWEVASISQWQVSA